MTDAARMTVLIVEDEWIIAEIVEQQLRTAGYDVLGPASNVAAAMKLLDKVKPHFAILDVQLRGERSYAVAGALLALGVPFLFATAYTASVLPEHLASRPQLSKPFATSALLAALSDLQQRTEAEMGSQRGA